MVIVFLVFVSLRKTHNLLYCGYTRTKIVFLCLSCFIVLNQGLYYVVVCASYVALLVVTHCLSLIEKTKVLS